MAQDQNSSARQRRGGSPPSSSSLESDSSKKVSFDVPSAKGVSKDHVNPAWGRFAGNEWFTVVSSAAIVLICPVLAVLSSICLEFFDGALFPTVYTFLTTNPIEFIQLYAPRPTREASLAYVGWLLFQAVLYAVVPSPIGYGQRTPAGHLLPYRVNGIHVWVLTHVMAVAAVVAGVLDPAYIAKNWNGLMVAANVYGYVLSFFAYFKAILFPTHPNDRKFSGMSSIDVFLTLG